MPLLKSKTSGTKSVLALLLTLLPLSLFISCNDNTSTIGSSLVVDRSEIVVDSAFTVTGRSVATGKIRARTLSQLLGRIDARSYGSLTSDYVTQLMPSADFDTTGVTPETVDSILLVLRFYSNRITGDSMTPMGMSAFALDRQLPAELTSSFDPAGFYNPSAPIASSPYSSNTLYSDSLEHMGVHVIQAKLPIELGKEFVSLYRRDPEVWTSPEAFADIFPGMYITTSFGAGRVTNIFNTRVVLYYHSDTKYTTSAGEERDTTYYGASIIAASTPEVLTNNNLRFNIDPLLTRMAADEPIVVAPIGYECRLNLPIDQVISSFRKGSSKAMGIVNSLSLTIPASKIENDYGIEPPSHLLLVPTRDRDKFFDEQMIPDNVTSYIAQYNATLGRYVFTGLRALMMHVMDGSLSPAETEELSDYSLVPVEIAVETYTNSSYEQVEVITAVGPSVESPSMARILVKDAKLKLTYSTETVNF